METQKQRAARLQRSILGRVYPLPMAQGLGQSWDAPCFRRFRPHHQFITYNRTCAQFCYEDSLSSQLNCEVVHRNTRKMLTVLGHGHNNHTHCPLIRRFLTCSLQVVHCLEFGGCPLFRCYYCYGDFSWYMQQCLLLGREACLLQSPLLQYWAIPCFLL